MATRQKKKESATGFRNGQLFCFNCGQSFSYKLPAPVQQFADQCKAFDKLHLHCEKTWQEPIPNPENKSPMENIHWWFNNGEHGTSSKAMAYRLSLALAVRVPDRFGHTINNYNAYPHDADDFSRCHKLLQAVPQFRPILHTLKTAGLQWHALVDSWDELTGLFVAGKYKEMNELMKAMGC